MPFCFGPYLIIPIVLLFAWPALLIGNRIDPKLPSGCFGDATLFIVSIFVTALWLATIVIIATLIFHAWPN
jgi:hypothetical protein